MKIIIFLLTLFAVASSSKQLSLKRKVLRKRRRSSGGSTIGDEEVFVYVWHHPKSQIEIRQTKREHFEMCNRHIKMVCDFNHFGTIHKEAVSAFEAYVLQMKRKDEFPWWTYFAEHWTAKGWFTKANMMEYEKVMDMMLELYKLAESCGAHVSNRDFFRCGSRSKENRDRCLALTRRESESTNQFNSRCVDLHSDCFLMFSNVNEDPGTEPCAYCDSGCDFVPKLIKQYDDLLDQTKHTISTIYAYDRNMLSSAESMKVALDKTRDVSFEIAIACAGATAAPTAIKNLGKGAHVLAKLVAGATAASVAAAAVAGFLTTIKVAINDVALEKRWPIIWDAAWEAAKDGAVGAGANLAGKEIVARGAACLLKITPKMLSTLRLQFVARLTQLFPKLTAFKKGLIEGITHNAIRTGIIGLYKSYKDKEYTSENFEADMVLSIYFGAFAKTAKVDALLGGRKSPIWGDVVQINGFAVTEKIFKSAEKMGAIFAEELEVLESAQAFSKQNFQSSDDIDGVTAFAMKVPTWQCYDRASCCALHESNTNAPILKFHRGPEVSVRALQSILIELETYLNIDEPTGFFGEKTRTAVEDFQIDYIVDPTSIDNDEPDGIVGPITWGELCRLTRYVEK